MRVAQSRFERIEFYVLGVIEGRRQGRGARVLRWFLRQLSYLFAGVVQGRLWLFRHGIRRYHTLGCQVVSVGNLTVGGTGKTPIVEIFGRSLARKGRRVAILSRGYKRREAPWTERLAQRLLHPERRPPPLVVSDGSRLLLDSRTSGDEPYMLAANLRDVAVLVDKNRVKSGRYAIDKLGCDTLVLDDGFQYLALKHRLDIVLVDATNPFGNRLTLPAGILREQVRNIRRASFIFITKCEEGGAPELKQALRALNPEAEIAECRHSPKYLQDVYTGARQALDYLAGRRVAAISGIAAPEGFERSLERLRATVVYSERYADHHRYSQQEIIDVINQAGAHGAELIVTTEKDAVRFPRITRRDLPVHFLRVEIEMLSGAEDFDQCIARICFQQ
ncbi:MAG: tetraacyldisaccharide 4'-kinase [Candidatus Marinimicrobia bacterium]|nr:tetraacyldisaccharide 4'-kinase [Candidatus Neomarinimicrobiota bacterium]